jgi:hypothetical protein
MADLRARLSVVCLLVGTACSASLPTPLPARQPRSAYRPVPYPPPAAFAEVVPRTPAPEALWVDGHWAWRGGKFVWQRGGWVIAPEGARFAHWRLLYSRDGTLQFAEDTWYDAHLLPMRKPKTILPALTPQNAMTPEAKHAP